MKTVAELEQDADRCKRQFEAKVAQIKQRLTPASLADEALRELALPSRAAADAIVDTARRNPLLILGLAAGVGWLFLSARQRALRPSRQHHKRVKEIGYVSTRR